MSPTAPTVPYGISLYKHNPAMTW